MQALRAGDRARAAGLLRPERRPERGDGGPLLPERARGDGDDRCEASRARRGRSHERRALSASVAGPRASQTPRARWPRRSRRPTSPRTRPRRSPSTSGTRWRSTSTTPRSGSSGSRARRPRPTRRCAPGWPTSTTRESASCARPASGSRARRARSIENRIRSLRGPATGVTGSPRRGAAAPAVPLAGPPSRRGAGRGGLVQRRDRPARPGARSADAVQRAPAGAHRGDGAARERPGRYTVRDLRARLAGERRASPWRDRTDCVRSSPGARPASGPCSRSSGRRSSSSSARWRASTS